MFLSLSESLVLCLINDNVFENYDKISSGASTDHSDI